jgi:hypothetical protein
MDEERSKQAAEELARAKQRLTDAEARRADLQAQADDAQRRLDACEAALAAARQETRDLLGEHLDQARSMLDEIEDALAGLFADTAVGVPGLVGLQTTAHRLVSTASILEVALATQPRSVHRTPGKAPGGRGHHRLARPAAPGAPGPGARRLRATGTDPDGPVPGSSRDPNEEQRPADAR